MSKYPAANITDSEDFRFVLFANKFDELPSLYTLLYERKYKINILFDIIEKAKKRYYRYWFSNGQKNLNVDLKQCIDDVYLEFDSFVLHISSTSDNYAGFTKTGIKYKKYSEVTLYFLYKEDHENISEMDDILKMLNDNSKKIKSLENKQQNYIYLFQQGPDGYYLKSYETKDPVIDIKLSYGESFVTEDQRIFDSLNTRDKGLWIFHGIPGTGKTVYLRNLIKRLNKSHPKRHIIYMPSEMIKALESPEFLPFMAKYHDSILILEDSDIALQSRDINGPIVNTLLNLTDGLLADCLRIKIIATFNCDLAKIDTALLRKGRLVIRHEFGYLSYDQAIELATSLKLDVASFDKTKEKWTLSDIYGINEDFHWDKTKKSIGF